MPRSCSRPRTSCSGKPADNSFVEALNGTVRTECIVQNWFLSLPDARLKCETFRNEYKCEKPYSSLGHKTPFEFMKPSELPANRWGHDAESSARPWSSVRAGLHEAGGSEWPWSRVRGRYNRPKELLGN
ncbi:transposase [Microvirga sp. BT688]|uniref:integrase core domain-containing protein n=1 Tax=Microvirga sp. TaxID=1873136 RepID=UPI0016889573|nr:transposase [Microvirga sp.]